MSKKLTKENFLKNMKEAFTPKIKNKKIFEKSEEKFQRKISFMGLISAGLKGYKGKKKKKWVYSISDMEKVGDWRISRSTQTRYPKDNFTADGKMKKLTVYELAELKPEVIENGLKKWVKFIREKIEKKGKAKNKEKFEKKWMIQRSERIRIYYKEARNQNEKVKKLKRCLAQFLKLKLGSQMKMMKERGEQLKSPKKINMFSFQKRELMSLQHSSYKPSSENSPRSPKKKKTKKGPKNQPPSERSEEKEFNEIARRRPRQATQTLQVSHPEVLKNPKIVGTLGTRLASHTPQAQYNPDESINDITSNSSSPVNSKVSIQQKEHFINRARRSSKVIVKEGLLDDLVSLTEMKKGPREAGGGDKPPLKEMVRKKTSLAMSEESSGDESILDGQPTTERPLVHSKTDEGNSHANAHGGSNKLKRRIGLALSLNKLNLLDTSKEDTASAGGDGKVKLQDLVEKLRKENNLERQNIDPEYKKKEKLRIEKMVKKTREMFDKSQKLKLQVSIFDYFRLFVPSFLDKFFTKRDLFEKVSPNLIARAKK
jgi:hypothetical protein